METTWDLSALYDGFETEKFQSDYLLLEQKINSFTCWQPKEPVESITCYLKLRNEIEDLSSRLLEYCDLTLSTDMTNELALKYLERLEQLLTGLTIPESNFIRFVSALEKLESIINKNSYLQQHQFYLTSCKRQGEYLLSNAEELLLAKLKPTSSFAFGKLQETLTSTLKIPFSMNGKQENYPLSAIRNFAYAKDAITRKQAYESELKACQTIEVSVAASLNSIKGEVLTESQLRGYRSPLDMTLQQSRMDFPTFEAMLCAIKKGLSYFEQYFQKKAEILGHKNGLPFYDLFAPIGELDMSFTYKQAQEFIIENFNTFSTKLGNYAKTAFEKRWIDVYPKEGKRGGAFCCNLHSIKQSRILTNFTGSFSDVITIAHELGHGYHGACLENQSFLNSDYPMPIAETASTFCETIVKNAALKSANKKERLIILETDLSDHAQVIVDIYSRFLFENSVFQNRLNGPLSAQEFSNLMLEAQKQAYRNGLDSHTLHRYMWIVKSHYYDADYNYYNFPYAFGLLFAKGLYRLYLEKGDAFVPQYDALLGATGNNDLKTIASMVDIDITKEEFWKTSLSEIYQEINLFLSQPLSTVSE